MPHLQTEAVIVMTNTLRWVESSIAPPERVPHKDSFVFRYANKGIREALVQKLARYISGLNAVSVLLSAGYVQEVGVIFRTLDEIQEDIFFLACAETNGAWSERHTQYLEAFYADAVFSRPEGALQISKPNLLPRKKIRAHTMNAIGQGVNVSQALDVAESLSTAYSGYVHAASENIMEMYGGNPPHFHVEGVPETPHIETFEQDTEIYIYRGVMVACVVAKAFGNKSLVEALYEFLAQYEVANGHGPSRGR
ncbi:hypothetical protein [Aquipseudomonas guryensis]|uniref:Uncharacterized protein n=1 Tax=Aquipseudomonas guryensis TaxID=2759165 RepID=A0A7W4DEA8_9GAMM|nr:hypothetical protein [Pseudomonas guryensis]MBB1520999.1 hypothetical protein [Pseudomonas guryensis]